MSESIFPIFTLFVKTVFWCDNKFVVETSPIIFVAETSPVTYISCFAYISLLTVRFSSIETSPTTCKRALNEASSFTYNEE